MTSIHQKKWCMAVLAIVVPTPLIGVLFILYLCIYFLFPYFYKLMELLSTFYSIFIYFFKLLKLIFLMHYILFTSKLLEMNI